jgi:hypothetical protein
VKHVGSKWRHKGSARGQRVRVGRAQARSGGRVWLGWGGPGDGPLGLSP